MRVVERDEVEVVIEMSGWDGLPVADIALEVAQKVTNRFGLPRFSSALLACDDAHITELNAQFRGKTKATNVLSWPSQDLAAKIDGHLPQPPSAQFDGELVLGDIAIAFETCQKEAQIAQIPLNNHVAHLILHGLLHLLGFDHVRQEDARLMERIEVETLEEMGIETPYKNSA